LLIFFYLFILFLQDGRYILYIHIPVEYDGRRVETSVQGFVLLRPTLG